MGRDTLVQEFKGRKDHADYIKRGVAVENYFTLIGIEGIFACC